MPEHVSETIVRPLTRPLRWLLLIGCLLVFANGIQLFILTEQTDRYFAWTIVPPITAAFLGAGYWAALVLDFLSARERFWARARVAVSVTIVFTAVTFLATLLHLNRFHLDRPIAWLWIFFYGLVPVALSVFTVRQLRVPGGEPARQSPFPGWMRPVLVFYAVVLLSFGVALFLTPQLAAPFWLWMLTPLTARAVGAWLIGLGVVAAHMVWENDFQRVRAAMVGFVVFGALQLVSLARFPGNVHWTGLGIWVYMLFLVSTLIIGLYGSASSRLVNRKAS